MTYVLGFVSNARLSGPVSRRDFARVGLGDTVAAVPVEGGPTRVRAVTERDVPVDDVRVERRDRG